MVFEIITQINGNLDLISQLIEYVTQLNELELFSNIGYKALNNSFIPYKFILWISITNSL